LTKRTPPTLRSSCWWVWPATTSRRDAAEHRRPALGRRDARDHLVVAAGVAWQKRTPSSSSVSGSSPSARARSSPSSRAVMRP
jgi:hypothetical protein